MTNLLKPWLKELVSVDLKTGLVDGLELHTFEAAYRTPEEGVTDQLQVFLGAATPSSKELAAMRRRLVKKVALLPLSGTEAI